MHLTIGILAYNESATIARTIASLLEQSVFTGRGATLPDVQWEVLVVPNGCSDDTQERAVEALRESCAACTAAAVSYRVESLQRAGKSHAWNKLVHEISAPHTDVFVMIDADIEFGHPDTIANCVTRLLTDSHAWAVVDLPLKDFHRVANPNLIARLSMRVSKTRLAHSTPGISGQFYTVASSRLRNVWLPIDLSVEDGFLMSMIITDAFRSGPDYTRVVRADIGSHYFEGLTRIREVIDHEVRIMIGSVLNNFLCWDMLFFLTPRNGPGAGVLVRDLNSQDPDWYRRSMGNQIEIRGLWAIRAPEIWERIGQWWAMPWPRRVLRLPLVLGVFGFDLLVMWLANRKLVSGRAVGYW
jgi:glycosyltransferase involved in cell wall biosynthesis